MEIRRGWARALKKSALNRRNCDIGICKYLHMCIRLSMAGGKRWRDGKERECSVPLFKGDTETCTLSHFPYPLFPIHPLFPNLPLFTYPPFPTSLSNLSPNPSLPILPHNPLVCP